MRNIKYEIIFAFEAYWGHKIMLMWNSSLKNANESKMETWMESVYIKKNLKYFE